MRWNMMKLLLYSTYIWWGASVFQYSQVYFSKAENQKKLNNSWDARNMSMINRKYRKVSHIMTDWLDGGSINFLYFLELSCFGYTFIIFWTVNKEKLCLVSQTVPCVNIGTQMFIISEGLVKPLDNDDLHSYPNSENVSHEKHTSLRILIWIYIWLQRSMVLLT